MKKFRVLFHKIPPRWEGLWYGLRHPVSGGIALATWSRYTHVEIWVPKLGVFRGGNVTVAPSWLGTCYTSTLRGKYDGACKRPASEVLKNLERWDYLEFECEDEDFAKMLAAMDKAVKENKGYDVMLILRFLAFVPVFNSRKYICTEFVQMGLKAAVELWWGPLQPRRDIVDSKKYIGYWFPGWRFMAKPLSPKALAKALPGEIRPLKED